MKKVVIILALMSLVIFVGNATAERMYVLCRPHDYVNVRSLPSTKGASVGFLDCGDWVETDGYAKKDNKGRTWIQVYGFEGEAWIIAMYLQDSPVVIEKCTGFVASNSRIALRRSPNGKRIKWLKHGTEVTILAMSEEWALTTRGYVRREYLDVYQ